MTDLVITYLNSNRPQWIESYNYYKSKEIASGIANENDRQSFGTERFRDWDNLHYWFRGVENNCKWVNKVFLIVQSKDQLPEWLNIDNPKLRIVTHDEFIPKKLLPTFNPLTIELFFHKIKDLSEQYISCNDDHFFLHPIKETLFFENGYPREPELKTKWQLYKTTTSDGTFYATLNNVREIDKDMINELYPGVEPWAYGFTHLPYPRLKSMDAFVFNKYKDKIMKGAKVSKFRNPKNYCSTIYDDALKIYNKTILDKCMFDKCAYIILKTSVDFKWCSSLDIVCFNDTEQLDDFNIVKWQLDKLFQERFPNKCSFEK